VGWGLGVVWGLAQEIPKGQERKGQCGQREKGHSNWKTDRNGLNSPCVARGDCDWVLIGDRPVVPGPGTMEGAARVWVKGVEKNGG